MPLSALVLVSTTCAAKVAARAGRLVGSSCRLRRVVVMFSRPRRCPHRAICLAQPNRGRRDSSAHTRRHGQVTVLLGGRNVNLTEAKLPDTVLPGVPAHAAGPWCLQKRAPVGRCQGMIVMLLVPCEAEYVPTVGSAM